MTGDADPLIHMALFYRGDREYLEAVVPFIRDGLDNGEQVLVAVPTEKLALVRDALGGDGARVSLTDMTDVGRNPARTFPALSVVDDSAGRARIVAEPVWPARSAEAYPACVQNEALFNTAFAGRALTTMCPYDAVGLDAAVLADARTTHPRIREGPAVSVSTDYAAEDAVRRYNQPLPEDPAAVTFRLATVDDLSAARAFVVRCAESLGLPVGRFGDLQLIVTELATNSLEYTDGACTIAMWRAGADLICQVSDGGRLDDPLAGRRLPATHGMGGRGLFLVNALADLVRTYTSPDGTTIRVYLSVDGR